MGVQELAYLVGLALAGAAVMWWLSRLLARTEARVRDRLAHIRRFEAVRSETPLQNPLAEARERSLGSAETRFRMLRLILVPACFLVILLAAVLPFLGSLPAAGITLLAAVVSVIVGVAAKPFVENLIGGVVISFAQPLRLGDTVMIDGEFGTVEDINLTHTLVKVWDWRRYVVPNSQLLQKEFVNYSLIDRYQWAYVEFWVEPEADLEVVRQEAIDAMRSSYTFAGYEDPRFWVMQMGREGIRCWVAGWADSPSAAWILTSDARTELARRLRAQGIRTHVHQVASRGEGPGPPPPLSPSLASVGVLAGEAATDDGGSGPQP